MHRRVATIHSDDVVHMQDAIAASAGLADLVEVRLDALWPGVPAPDDATDDLVGLTTAAGQNGVPLLATLRPKRQGGAFDGPEDVRLSLLVAAAQSGFTAIDLEADHEDDSGLVTRLRKEASFIIASDHSAPHAPTQQDGLIRLQAMQDTGADVEKFAFPAGSFADLLRALELTHQHAGRHGHPAVMPFGFGDAATRCLLAVAGARLSYGHAPNSRPAVSGQPALADMQAVWDHWGITADDLEMPGAGWYAILGNPVSHSLSPRLHNAALRAAGLDPRFGALQVPDSVGAVRLIANAAGRLGLRGASVTAPLKRHAHDASEPDVAAKAVGAVNCLRFDRGSAEGTNTDALAVRGFLAPHMGAGDAVVVLGAGGAARAAIWGAQDLGAEVCFTSRDPERAADVAADFDVTWVPWDERHDLAPVAWVQATPIGSAHDDPSPVAEAGLRSTQAVVEMVYKSGPTAFQTSAASAGCAIMDGRQMLLEQAVHAFHFWTGHDPDRSAMQEALA